MLIAIIIILLLFGGFGWHNGYYAGLPGGNGTGLVGLLLIILIVFLLLGRGGWPYL